MIVTPFQKTERYIACPACGKGEHQVSHLNPGQKTAWYCQSDTCGRRFSLEVLTNGDISVGVLPERKVPTLVTLRSEQPVTLVVKGMQFVKDGETPRFTGDPRDEDEYHPDNYFYNEHTCPTNYLNVLELRTDDGDTDPHGVFAYVRTEPWSARVEEGISARSTTI